MVDVVIVGGGPGGLSAALILGRCRRNVLVFDSGKPRNAASHAMHGFLSRDGIKPQDFLQIARDQLAIYKNVKLENIEVVDACSKPPGFEVILKDGRRIDCKKILFATGVVDNLPPVAGIELFYGRSIFHCPYCDGWESSDQRIVIYGNDRRALGLAMKLMTWSRKLTLCTDGPAGLDNKERDQLKRNEIVLIQKKLDRFDGKEGVLSRIIFQDGTTLECDVVFFSLGQELHSPLPAKLGAELSEKGNVKTGTYESTCVPGLFVAGDASEELQLVVLAAAEGAKAAFAINTAFQKEEEK